VSARPGSNQVDPQTIEDLSDASLLEMRLVEFPTQPVDLLPRVPQGIVEHGSGRLGLLESGLERGEGLLGLGIQEGGDGRGLGLFGGSRARFLRGDGFLMHFIHLVEFGEERLQGPMMDR